MKLKTSHWVYIFWSAVIAWRCDGWPRPHPLNWPRAGSSGWPWWPSHIVSILPTSRLHSSSDLPHSLPAICFADRGKAVVGHWQDQLQHIQGAVPWVDMVDQSADRRCSGEVLTHLTQVDTRRLSHVRITCNTPRQKTWKHKKAN